MGDGVVLAAMRLLAALPEEAHDLDRLREHLDALVSSRPAVAEDVLVQVLAGAETEEEPPAHQAGACGCRVRDDRRMDSDHRTRHAGSEAQAFRGLGDAADHAPDERARTLLVDPG